jgi:hypothetical protein
LRLYFRLDRCRLLFLLRRLILSVQRFPSILSIRLVLFGRLFLFLRCFPSDRSFPYFPYFQLTLWDLRYHYYRLILLNRFLRHHLHLFLRLLLVVRLNRYCLLIPSDRILLLSRSFLSVRGLRLFPFLRCFPSDQRLRFLRCFPSDQSLLLPRSYRFHRLVPDLPSFPCFLLILSDQYRLLSLLHRCFLLDPRFPSIRSYPSILSDLFVLLHR